MRIRFKVYALIIAGLLVWFSPYRWYVIPPNIALEDYYFTKMEPFNYQARVLSREPYFFDGSAAISPIDLALGWGPVFDEEVIEQLDISPQPSHSCLKLGTEKWLA